MARGGGYAKHFLSPSALDDFLKCPRCFWIDKVKKIKKPRGAFPSLPGGMDRIIKDYCDSYRLKGELPPQFEGKVKGRLFSDMEQLRKMRYWKTSPLSFIDEALSVKVTGAVDDLLQAKDGYSTLDYKTRGSAIAEGKDPFEYYRNQLNTYDLMLNSTGFKTNGRGYLTYWTPALVAEAPTEDTANVRFDVAVFQMATEPEAARQTIAAAVHCLEGELPDPGTDPYTHGPCEVCAFVDTVSAER